MPSISTRPAKLSDAEFLLALKNDYDVRKFSIVTKKKIKFKNHLKWFAEHIDEIEIIEVDGVPVGDIRIAEYNLLREVAIKLQKDSRGQGVGKYIISNAPGRLMAKVADGNVPSLNLFYGCGFTACSYNKKKGVGYWTLLRTPF